MHSWKALVPAVALFLTSVTYGQCCDIRVKYLAPPIYPAVANVAKIESAMKVHVKVSADGRVLSAKGSGAHEILNHASEEENPLVDFFCYSAGCEFTISYVYKLEGQELTTRRSHASFCNYPAA